MKLIPLTRGHFSKVDDEDFEELSKYKWQVGIVKKTGYKRAQRLCAITGKTVLMHRQLMNPAHSRILVDHEDRDPLNNQKYNLRLASSLENGANQGISKSNKSGYKGVFWHEKNLVFTAKIKVGRKDIQLGSFDDIHDAARAYNKAAKEHHKEFACFNMVDPLFPSEEKRRPSRNTSGFIGVSRLPNGKWAAEVKRADKRIRINGFVTKEDAHMAYLEAKKSLYCPN